MRRTRLALMPPAETQPEDADAVPGARPNVARQRLGDRLTRLIVGWACLCALVTAAVQGVLSWRETREHFEDAVIDITSSHAPLIATLIARGDQAALREEMTQLAERPEIGYTKLRVFPQPQVPTGIDPPPSYQNGLPGLASTPPSRAIVLGAPGDPNRAIARLEVTANPQVFYRELLHNVGTSTLGYALLTLLVSLLVRRILEAELQRPLRELAESVSRLDSDRLSVPVRLAGRPLGARDEIDLVVDGIGVLQRSLNRHIVDMDQRVAQRTEELQNALTSIREMSIRDPLTGCHNRQHFNERIVHEVQRVARYGRGLAILFADIDRFKQINDSRGHIFGDEVLRAFVAAISTRIRDGVDWVARYGGEEFVVVMPETSLEGARATAEKLRQAVEQIVVRTPEGEPVGITASFGVAELQPQETVISFIDRADRNLYEAKVAGRNRVGGTGA